jgi:hypothetical protein
MTGLSASSRKPCLVDVTTNVNRYSSYKFRVLMLTGQPALPRIIVRVLITFPEARVAPTTLLEDSFPRSCISANEPQFDLDEKR